MELGTCEAQTVHLQHLQSSKVFEDDKMEPHLQIYHASFPP